MPEGDTIYRTARTLHRALAGLVVTGFASPLAAVSAAARDAPIPGRSVERVEPRGKHVLTWFSGDRVLRTHLRMHGSWHLYRPGERWRAPARDARVVIETAAWVAVAFNVMDVELLSAAGVARHARLLALGPDLLAESPDLAEIGRRLRRMPARSIGDALLSQHVAAGLGNVYKSELLFLAGIHPFTLVGDLPDRVLDQLIADGVRLLRLNVAEGGVAWGRGGGRRTTGRLNPRESLWVYDRAGDPCRRCGTAIQSAGATGGRRTYWCPTCQPSTVAASDDAR